MAKLELLVFVVPVVAHVLAPCSTLLFVAVVEVKEVIRHAAAHTLAHFLAAAIRAVLKDTGVQRDIHGAATGIYVKVVEMAIVTKRVDGVFRTANKNFTSGSYWQKIFIKVLQLKSFGLEIGLYL